MDIRGLLYRRADLSTFVVHFTRATDDTHPARANLESILHNGRICAGRPMGMAVSEINQAGPDQAALNSQKVVCFTEVPLEHAYAITCPIANRGVQLSAYGIGFGKMWARRKGINPVWYIDQTPGHDWLSEAVNSLIQDAIQAGPYAESPVAKLSPFMESMGTWAGGQKEFWWEREWRCRGDLPFSVPDVAVGLCPEDDIRDLEVLAKEIAEQQFDRGVRYPRFVDPSWSLELIIARLAGMVPGDVSPF